MFEQTNFFSTLDVITQSAKDQYGLKSDLSLETKLPKAKLSHMLLKYVFAEKNWTTQVIVFVRKQDYASNHCIYWVTNVFTPKKQKNALFQCSLKGSAFTRKHLEGGVERGKKLAIDFLCNAKEEKGELTSNIPKSDN